MKARHRGPLINWRGSMSVVAVALLASCGPCSPKSSYTPPAAQLTPNRAGTPTPGLAAIAWSVSPLQAQFDQACFCTRYGVDILATKVNSSNDTWTVTWTLTLRLVDPAGAPDPTEPGTNAGVDAGCDNAGRGTAKPVVDAVTVRFASTGSRGDDSFTWYHPDPASAPPGYDAGFFHCNHTLQGPHGHQGAVSVSIEHGAQKCTDLLIGSHSAASTDQGQPGSANCFRT